jgi:branched-subunit amino acid transport protein
MNAVWITVAVMYVVTTVMKAVGPATIGGHELSERVANVVGLVAPALLAALVVYETLIANTRGIQPDARLAGIAIAALAVALRAPIIVVVALAAIATAATRALT